MSGKLKVWVGLIGLGALVVLSGRLTGFAPGSSGCGEDAPPAETQQAARSAGGRGEPPSSGRTHQPRDGDEDGDGVPDSRDLCRTPPAGDPTEPHDIIGPHGCPLVVLPRACLQDEQHPEVSFVDVRAMAVKTWDAAHWKIEGVRVTGLVDVDDSCPAWHARLQARFRVGRTVLIPPGADNPTTWSNWTPWRPCLGMNGAIGPCQVPLGDASVDILTQQVSELDFDIEAQVVVRAVDGAANATEVIAAGTFDANECLRLRREALDQPVVATSGPCEAIACADGAPPVLISVTADGPPALTIAGAPGGTWPAAAGLLVSDVQVKIAHSVVASDSSKCAGAVPRFGGTFVAKLDGEEAVNLPCAPTSTYTNGAVYTAKVVCQGTVARAHLSPATKWRLLGQLVVEDDGLNIVQSDIIDQKHAVF